MKDKRLEIICSPHTGFCFGVKRAMKLIEEGLSVPELKIFSIGDVIHNPQAVDRLKSLGVTPASSMEELSEGDTLVIRAHGLDPDIRDDAVRRGIRLIDTTCPFVRKSQEYVEEMIAESRQVIIIGDPRHPEVTGIAGRAGGTAVIIESMEDADRVSEVERAGVVIQTTLSREKAMEMVDNLKKKIVDIIVHDTICEATTKRQVATMELASRVDMILIVGGRASSNTRKLYQMCLDNGIKAEFIETADEIKDEWFTGLRKVGLTTGTSTPEWVIDDVMKRLSEIAASS